MSNKNLSAYVLDGFASNDVAESIIKSGKQADSFFIEDLDKAYERIRHFNEMMPRVQIFYAMKSNDSPMLLKLAISQGLGFDCASSGEIYKVLKLGGDPQKIVFAAPLKLPEWMTYAQKSGVKLATFDMSIELERIKEYWPDANLLIRIKVDGDSVYRLGDKYGCDFETEAIDLLEKAASLGVKVIGVAFHVGSVCSSTDTHATGIRLARELFDYEESRGRKMSIVDIGGGFLSQRTEDIDEVSRLINISLKQYFPDESVQIIAEPGRYICDSSMTLYCSINATKKVKKDDEYVNMIYINDGVYGTLQFAEVWQTVNKFERGSKAKDEKFEKTVLWGYSCDSMDRVFSNLQVLLPKCTPEDWLVFPLRGAYSFVFNSSFSCFEEPSIRPVVSVALWKKIKDSFAFDPEDFVVNPDISAPLPKTPLDIIYPEKQQNGNAH